MYVVGFAEKTHHEISKTAAIQQAQQKDTQSLGYLLALLGLHPWSGTTTGDRRPLSIFCVAVPPYSYCVGVC
jgi:hypothetical protein